MLYIINKVLTMLCMYAKLSSYLLAVGKTKTAAAHMQGTVFTLASLKIVPTIKNLYRIQFQCVDELISLV